MNEFFRKFYNIEKEASDEKGNFDLFAIFLKSDSIDKWDIVASAKWLKKQNYDDLKYLTDIIKKHLGNDLDKLSRVVVLDENDVALKSIHSTVEVVHGSMEVVNANFFGMFIKKAFIVTSKRR